MILYHIITGAIALAMLLFIVYAIILVIESSSDKRYRKQRWIEPTWSGNRIAKRDVYGTKCED